MRKDLLKFWYLYINTIFPHASSIQHIQHAAQLFVTVAGEKESWIMF